jgi:hypothetical protein
MVASQPPSALVQSCADAKPRSMRASSSARFVRLSRARVMQRPAIAAKKVAYARRLKRTSSMGPSRKTQMPPEKTVAVMAAMRASGTCCAARSCGRESVMKPA